MKLFSSRSDRRRALFWIAVVGVGFVALYYALRRFAPFVFDPTRLRLWIRQFDRLAPLVLVGVQAAQVILAPIPGQIVAFVAGFLFGPVAGILFTLVGVLVGSAVAFMLSKWYGRSFVEDVVDEDVVDRFDSFVDEAGIPGLLVFVAVPGLPDDVVCYAAGLTKWRLRTFMLVMAVGRLPGYVVTVYAGSELASGRILYSAALSAVVVVLSVIGYYEQATIRDLSRRLESRLPV